MKGIFKHILVPLDGSAMAEAALPVAAFLTERLKCRVTLMHVIEKDAPSVVHGQTHLVSAPEASVYLREVAKKYFARPSEVECHVHTTEVDNVAASIVAHAGELSHDLVVMCSHGKGAALHLILGSIAQRVIAMDRRPVLITHPAEKGAEPRAFNCRHILVPLDGQPEHAQGLPASKELARSCGATVHLAFAVPELTSLSGDKAMASRMLPGTTSRLLDLSMKDAEAYLTPLARELQEEGFLASAHVLRGDPAKVIMDAAVNAKIDLIVLTTHGKTGMDAFWAGSVTHKIVSKLQVPLLLIPVTKL
ncbi:universal stress protein [Geomonas sp. RF6]|uniref:universal stress protein n=1 Tax=Geomonas sp. RF6 TaxID=2897342 RepID=UPI001E4DFBE1|nr:universal stress protein [Geomonas sp. RF6]UFS70308.1 universal stress protein [Geomonas sp. RF6]